MKVREDGTVKVLDFGLAKALGPEGSSAKAEPTMSQSPTIATPAMTQMGIILGTAADMAPEQARGRPVDKRGDIWGFGYVLYEMLPGRRAFEGEDISLTLAEVMKSEPDWSAVPVLPHFVESCLRRSFKKDPRQRLRDIGEMRLALDGAFESPAHVPAPAASTSTAATSGSGQGWPIMPLSDSPVTTWPRAVSPKGGILKRFRSQISAIGRHRMRRSLTFEGRPYDVSVALSLSIGLAIDHRPLSSA